MEHLQAFETAAVRESQASTPNLISIEPGVSKGYRDVGLQSHIAIVSTQDRLRNKKGKM
jgi:hypothetical protein